MKPKPSDKIYVHEISAEELTEKFPYHVCYIRKDALLEWAKEKNERIDTDDGDYSLGYVSAMIDLIDKLNSM